MLYIVTLVVVIAVLSNIFTRINRIEEKLRISETKEESPTPTVDQSGIVSPSEEKVETVPQPLGKNTSTQRDSSDLVAWFRENWLMKVGGLLILIAFGWFISHAFAQGWIGPAGQVSMGLVFGAGVMVFGLVLLTKKENKNKGVVTAVLGSTIILATMMAGQFIYNFFEPITTLISMLAVTSIVATFSVLKESKALAFSSLILGAVTPVLISVDLGVMGMLSYVAVIVLGTIWIVALTKWRTLTIFAFLATAIYSSVYLFPWSAEVQTAYIFALGFAVVFLIINILSYLWEQTKLHESDVIVTYGTGIFLLVWILRAVGSSVQSIVLLGVAVILGCCAYLLYRKMDSLVPSATFFAISLVFIAVATFIEFSGATLTIVYALEIFTLITLLAAFIPERVEGLRVISVLYIVPIILSVPQILSSSWNDGIFHIESLTLLVLTVVFLLSGVYFYDRIEGGDEASDKSYIFTNLYATATAGYATLLLWLTLHASTAISSDIATAISLLIYTVVGLYLYFRGKRDQTFAVYLGLILVWGVIARLMFAEFWLMDTTGKIVTFLIIGGILFATAFIKPDDVLQESKESSRE
ncbi:MAG: DUF2339 domain-containing protein [Candidatus Paceibacterota bacterium]